MNIIALTYVKANKNKNGFVVYEDFEEIIKEWGFVSSKELIRDLFNWIDMDKDSRISFEDLRQSAGKETNPTEQLFFRQDVKPGK